MGLLDGGLARVFGAALSGLYLEGVLYTPSRSDDGFGTISTSWSAEAVRVQIDATTWAMRQADGFSDTDVRLLILSADASPVTTDCELEVSGNRYSIASVARDPAGAYYDCRGRLK